MENHLKKTKKESTTSRSAFKLEAALDVLWFSWGKFLSSMCYKTHIKMWLNRYNSNTNSSRKAVLQTAAEDSEMGFKTCILIFVTNIDTNWLLSKKWLIKSVAEAMTQFNMTILKIWILKNTEICLLTPFGDLYKDLCMRPVQTALTKSTAGKFFDLCLQSSFSGIPSHWNTILLASPLGWVALPCVFHHFPPYSISSLAVQSQSTAMPGLFSSTTKMPYEVFILQPFSYYPCHLLMSYLKSHSLE